MQLETERLILRPWRESDAESLYEYAKDPEIGPIAGWPAHTSVEYSRDIINNKYNNEYNESYAVCIKGSDNQAIGNVVLHLFAASDLALNDDECELGYWIGKPFWGKGYIPEAAKRLIRHGFEDLGMNIIWCGYYDGNEKSKRCQEKIGLNYQHTCNEVPVSQMNEIRIGHVNYITKEQWLKNCQNRAER